MMMMQEHYAPSQHQKLLVLQRVSRQRCYKLNDQPRKQSATAAAGSNCCCTPTLCCAEFLVAFFAASLAGTAIWVESVVVAELVPLSLADCVLRCCGASIEPPTDPSKNMILHKGSVKYLRFAKSISGSSPKASMWHFFLMAMCSKSTSEFDRQDRQISHIDFTLSSVASTLCNTIAFCSTSRMSFKRSSCAT